MLRRALNCALTDRVRGDQRAPVALFVGIELVVASKLEPALSPWWSFESSRELGECLLVPERRASSGWARTSAVGQGETRLRAVGGDMGELADEHSAGPGRRRGARHEPAVAGGR